MIKRNTLSRNLYLKSKEEGFSDEKIIELSNSSSNEIKKLKKKKNKLFSSFRNIDTCAGEFQSHTPYMYSSWSCADQNQRFEKETQVGNNKKVIILGGGPNRIGQELNSTTVVCIHPSQ